MIVFFDGICHLCQSSVLYLIKHDKKKILKFASFQGDYAKSFLSASELQSMKSILLYDGKNIYKKSEAVLKLSKFLGGWHRLLLLGYLFPAVLRNCIYDLIAKNRYRWFGKLDQCMIPSKSLMERFLD